MVEVSNLELAGLLHTWTKKRVDETLSVSFTHMTC